MRRLISILVVALLGCSAPPDVQTAAKSGATSAKTRTPICTWFDPNTARDLMTWRREFDAAEAQAVADFDEAMGQYRNVVAMPIEAYRDQAYRDQVAGREVARARSAAWLTEQQKRAAAAWLVRNKRVDAAEAELRRKTVATLKAFFNRELKERRISKADHERFAGGDLEKNEFLSIRRRKWAGPAVYAFNGTRALTPEYLVVLREVRKLWHAQAISVPVVWTKPEPAFYSKLGVN